MSHPDAPRETPLSVPMPLTEARSTSVIIWTSAEAEIAALRAEVATLRAERDKWLDNFNKSEQFQNGPTKRAEAAEARLAAQAEALETLEQEMRDRVQSMSEGVSSTYWNPTLTIIQRWADRLAALRTTP